MLKLQNVAKVYKLDNETTFTALKPTNLVINDGEFSSIMGPSGSGKSTLMHIIGLLDKPSQGKIFIGDKNVSSLNDNETSSLRNKFIGFVFQQFNLLNKLTNLENILLPTLYAREKLDFSPRQKAMYLMKRFGIDSKADSYPNKISGGQQQRVAIARALIMNPSLILADEPTGNLDSQTGEEIMSLFTTLNHDDHITIVIVTHEHDIAKKTRRIIKIKDGKIEALRPKGRSIYRPKSFNPSEAEKLVIPSHSENRGFLRRGIK